MSATKIMIIRHAEKPSKDGTIQGVTAEGKTDPEELIVRGWERSGALVRFFAPANSKCMSPGLATPDIIFASRVGPDTQSQSMRPQHTVLALADALGMRLNLNFAEGQEEALADAAVAQAGVVLIAWEHKAIHLIANRIIGDNTTCPQIWHGKRFDLVYVFDAVPGGGWNFSQVPQLLLSGDKNKLMPMDVTPQQQEAE